ncbi:MAG: hypothetical protein J5917_01085 [Bacteroidales bacterium]|nr:hypothetical protein [Bacteroidales bacterium]
MKKSILIVFCLGVVFFACKKTPAPEVQEHAFTEAEQVKVHLEESFDAFFAALDIDSTVVKNPRRFIWDNSSVRLDLADRGAVVYRLERNGQKAMEARFYPVSGEVSAVLHGGVAFKGRINPVWSTRWEDWEAASDVKVYDQGMEVAKLGYEPGLYSLVLRFADGTSYALNAYVLSESLMDYLIENVFSTE